MEEHRRSRTILAQECSALTGQGIWEGLSSLIDLLASQELPNQSNAGSGGTTPGSTVTHSSGGQAAASTQVDTNQGGKNEVAL